MFSLTEHYKIIIIIIFIIRIIIIAAYIIPFKCFVSVRFFQKKSILIFKKDALDLSKATNNLFQINTENTEKSDF